MSKKILEWIENYEWEKIFFFVWWSSAFMFIIMIIFLLFADGLTQISQSSEVQTCVCEGVLKCEEK